MQSTRHVERDLRRARLKAARGYKAGTVCWRAILGGYWDRGEIVRRHMPKEPSSSPSE